MKTTSAADAHASYTHHRHLPMLGTDLGSFAPCVRCGFLITYGRVGWQLVANQWPAGLGHPVPAPTLNWPGPDAVMPGQPGSEQWAVTHGRWDPSRSPMEPLFTPRVVTTATDPAQVLAVPDAGAAPLAALLNRIADYTADQAPDGDEGWSATEVAEERAYFAALENASRLMAVVVTDLRPRGEAAVRCGLSLVASDLPAGQLLAVVEAILAPPGA